MWNNKKKRNFFTLQHLQILLLLVSLLFIQMSFPGTVAAATFSIKTGTYVGDGTDNRQITGIGFQPDLVLLKDNTSAGNNGMIMKTSVMSGELSLAIAETDSPLNTNHIQSLDSDGFTIGTDADVNSPNIMYYYIAIGGSDCSVSGTFCVGSYTGSATPQNITSVGFQPDLIGLRGNTTQVGVWRSSTMTGTESYFFSNTARVANQRITALLSNGFTVGTSAQVNSNAVEYYYFALKEVVGHFDVGTYTGNGLDGRIIDSSLDTNLNFQPDAVFVKSRNNVSMIGNIREHYGDRSFLFTDSNSAANHIQLLLNPKGFEIGTSSAVNTNATVFHYIAFGGAGTHNTDKEGTYEMAQGGYVGTGNPFSISGLEFKPDLVIIKGDTAEHGVFRTSIMAGDRTAYFANNASVFTGGIIALNADGFSVGASSVTNNLGGNYQWTAFGNASRIDKAGGAADFMVGQYIGSGNDNTLVRDIGFTSDLLVVKRVGNSRGVFRTSDQIGDRTLFFSNIGQGTNRIQSFSGDGFEKGTNGEVNSSNSTYDYFIFEHGERFFTGTYTGNGSEQELQSVGFQPDLLWVKKTTGGTARQGVVRSSGIGGDGAFPFLNATTIFNSIVDLVLNGFSVGSALETNENGFVYQYVGWNNKKYTQQGYRFFRNTNSTDVGSPLGSQNISTALDAQGSPFRLRLLIRVENGNLFKSAEEFTLQFTPQVGTCDSEFFGETYQDVTTSSTIRFFDNTIPETGDAITPNIQDPTDGMRIISHQSYNEDSPQLPTVGSVLQGQTAQFDYALIADTAPRGSYCLRMVYQDGTELERYSEIPELNIEQEVSFSISDNSIGFGEVSHMQTKYASGDSSGSLSEVSAHTLSASTNAANGYTIQISGPTLSCISCGPGIVIDAIGDVAESPTVGSEQFGIRAATLTGSGIVSSPYDSSDWAYAGESNVDVLATGFGDSQTTDYEVNYMTNISQDTDAGIYRTFITFTMTATF